MIGLRQRTESKIGVKASITVLRSNLVQLVEAPSGRRWRILVGKILRKRLVTEEARA